MQNDQYLTDPSTITREQAVLLFTNAVQEAQRVQNLDLIKAWNSTKSLYPALAAKAFELHDPMESRTKRVGTFSDSAQVTPPRISSPYSEQRGPARKLSIAIPNEGNIEALGLPRDASYEEFRASDIANKGASPRDSKAIIAALIALLVSAGHSPESAAQAASDRFPTLTAETKKAT